MKSWISNTSRTVAIAILVSGCLGMTQAIATAADFGPETLALINAYRGSRGLAPLTSNRTLQALARQHSRYQAARNRLGHDGFRQRSAQAKAAGLSVVCAENVGYNYQNAQQLFTGWKNSALHRTNLLRPNLRYAGVSVVGPYSTFFACR
ncbi:CAP domain-containing protein [Aminobacter sp. AP02]|uniref:CAP domain-containing protein n=1 Tax=Aminobacter sp. AP02 TaxID=2135737 RepID=UPI000D6D1502|nr:Cysteine-rich secretory protein family protein [Aminobacter sp. AP02]